MARKQREALREFCADPDSFVQAVFAEGRRITRDCFARLGRTNTAVIARLDQAIQYAQAYRSTMTASGILDRPGDDGGG